MFVGDGINDSPVLAQSDVGCAINSASDITVGAAGIVLIRDDLGDVLNAILIAQKSFQRIKINFAWAFVYNIVLIPIALGMFYPIQKFKMNPMYAAVAMAMSSISVVTSSLFLKLYNPKSEIESKLGSRTDPKKVLSRVHPGGGSKKKELIPLQDQASIALKSTTTPPAVGAGESDGGARSPAAGQGSSVYIGSSQDTEGGVTPSQTLGPMVD